MKRQLIIWGIILVLLLSSITPIVSMKLNDGWVYDEDTGTLSIEFSGKTKENYILKYGLIETQEVGYIFNTSYSFSETSIGFIEVSYNRGETWKIVKEYYKSNQDLRDLFITLTTECLWIRFTVDSESGDGYWIISHVNIIGDTQGKPPNTKVGILGTFTFWHWVLQVELDAYDSVNGVKEIHYLLFGKEFIVDGSFTKFKVQESGIHTLTVWSIDKNGNEEVPNIVPYILRIDNILPKLDLIHPKPGLYLFGKKMPISINKTIIVGDFDMEVIAVDDTSGIYKIQYILDGDVINEATEKPYLRTCREKHNGIGLLKVIAEDYAGNTVEETLDIYYYNFF